MKFRTTLFFILLFAGVLGFYLSQTKQEAARVEQIKKSSDDFKVQVEEKGPELKKKQTINFIQVQVLKKEETFWLEKQEDKWQLVYPVRARADQAMAEGMAGMIKMALNQNVVRPEGGWEEYGLDHPEIKIGVGTTEDSERHFLYLGKDAPFGDGVFARWDDKNAFFVLPAAVKSAFKKSVYEMREKRVFLTPIPKIDRIYIEIGDKTFDWALRKGVWYWMEPIDLIGKTMAEDQMAAVIQVLSRLYIKEFVDNDKGDAYAAGISMISDRIQIRFGKEVETVYFGNEATLKTAYYAHRENEKALFLIDQTKIIQILDLLDALDKVNHTPELVAAAKSGTGSISAIKSASEAKPPH